MSVKTQTSGVGTFPYLTQYPPDLYHPVGHFPPSSLGIASLSELAILLQYDPDE